VLSTSGSSARSTSRSRFPSSSNEVNTKNEIGLLLNLININTNDKILDLCCGQGRHAIELVKMDYSNVEGIDCSSYLISVAKKRTLDLHLNIKLSEGDARNINLPDNSKDCVIIMGNSFGYFEREEDDNAVLCNIFRILSPNGKLLLDIADGEWISKNFDKRSWEWIDNEYFVNRERTLSADSRRLITREVVINAKSGVIADQFYAERLYSFEDLQEKLAQIGFININKNNRVVTHSARDQDLGMMAHRFFVTAEVSKDFKLSNKKTTKKNITVLMRDRNKPDKIKLDNKFNTEDFHTINKLKEVLHKLTDFDFEYIDNNEHLINKLTTKKPDFIFNLCDEGYNNKAELELHIPALLEMLNIPYSGASPKALSLCYDKAKVRAIAKEFNIPVPKEFYINSDDYSALAPVCLPALIKPSMGDSSFGITKNAKVNNANELFNYIEYLREILPGVPILIQEFLSGVEYSVSLIGNYPNIEILPILEVDYSVLPPSLPKILSYESKWMPNSDYWNKISYKPAVLHTNAKDKLIHYSKSLFRLLDCQDYARIDFRADSNGKIKLLEVNPNPGWCWDGKMNMMAGFANITYHDLLNKILTAALQRYQNK
jgi:D-alanine-D-alanine ligase